MSDKQNSVKISGTGTIGGGTYDRVSISGAGKVTGDLIAEELKISGSGKVQGRAQVTQVVTSGSASFTDAIVAEEMRVSGSTRVDGRVEVKELKCSGTFKVARGIASEYVKVSGVLRVGADVEADIFKASGGFHIEGLLSADRIEIHLGGRCQAKEIGGEKIEVRRGGFKQKGIILDSLIKMLAGGGAAELQANQIEGDQIYLEGTTADIVRGKHIQIGPGCHIGAVEYEETLEVEPSARVDEQKKL